MLGGADNPNGELPSYITGADKQQKAACVVLNPEKSHPYIEDMV